MKKILIIFLIVVVFLAGGFALAYNYNEDFKNWFNQTAKIGSEIEDLPISTDDDNYDSVIKDLQKQINELRSDFLTVENNLADALAKNVKLTLDLQKSNEDLVTVNNKLTTANEQLSAKQTALDAALSQTEKDTMLIIELQADKVALQATISSLEISKNNLTGDILTLQNEKLAQQDLINDLQNENTSLNNEISRLVEIIDFYANTLNLDLGNISLICEGGNFQVSVYLLDTYITLDSFTNFGYEIYIYDESQYSNERNLIKTLTALPTRDDLNVETFYFESIDLEPGMYYVGVKAIFTDKSGEKVLSLVEGNYSSDFYFPVAGKVEIKEAYIDYQNNSVHYLTIFGVTEYSLLHNGVCYAVQSCWGAETMNILGLEYIEDLKAGDIISIIANGDGEYNFDSDPFEIVYSPPEN